MARPRGAASDVGLPCLPPPPTRADCRRWACPWLEPAPPIATAVPAARTQPECVQIHKPVTRIDVDCPVDNDRLRHDFAGLVGIPLVGVGAPQRLARRLTAA